ncbi:ankyrin repeat and EF-hand domain-containing protein 1-like isoform X2 [Mya arenaria]|uniref:ankyrin repeat and EF-hand domain-containing protein 1-like isoform X3 n=1 Tax=Mya arenaria TaxID=6604 RepID=UPI0022E43A01|nr:ankyrin repeat and EF-hand domain-containing protein 1-like isoform X3 [Mya arenaria]XP_052770247.1 ankyrin repeat and EF-hand domain-containing protein 1-like isoform X2 [Mya arenaria]
MPLAQTRLETLQVCKLLQCVRDKDKAQIEKMSMQGVPHLINYNDANEGHTALSVAATANDEDMIDFLLSLGAHPDVVDFKGRSAAMRAAEYGHVDCLAKLAEKGANMKLTDREGKGILFYCISPTQRHAKCLEIAVLNGAEPNNTDKQGIPVLLHACETAMDNEDMCLLLVQKGAEPNSKQEKTGKTALMGAAASGSVKVVRALLQNGADVNVTDLRHNHASHFAAANGHLEVLACMAGYGALFDQVNAEGNTPLHNAAAGGHGMCLKFLGQRGCNPKPKNNEGNTARTIAKDMGNKEAMKEARKAEKAFGKVGKNNEPYAIALYDFIYERQDMVKNMFQKYYDPDEEGTVSKNEFLDTIMGMSPPISEEELRRVQAAQDKGGKVDYNEFISGKKYVNKNYLMSAFEGKKKKGKKGKKGGKKKGKFKLVMPICTSEDGPRTYGGGPPEMFIERHIHFTDTGRFDRDHPPKHPLQDDSAWYLQHPEKTYLNINDAARSGDFDSMKNAFQRGVSADTRDKYYKTPLMVAASSGNMEMVKFLLDNGASVNARDNFKWTPLHHAAHAGQLDIVETLLAQGAEMEATAMSGGTPLTRAIESSREQVVEFLMSKGARVQIENKKGHTPLDIAQSWADPRVLQCVQSRFDSLPPLKDGKGKKGKGGGKATPKRPQSVPAGDGDLKPPGTARDNPSSARALMEEGQPRQRKGSILRAASALAGGLDEQENITYTPLKAWTKQPTTGELIHEKVVNRDRFGWEVDFEDFEMPFKKNVSNKIQEMGGVDDD